MLNRRINKYTILLATLTRTLGVGVTNPRLRYPYVSTLTLVQTFFFFIVVPTVTMVTGVITRHQFVICALLIAITLTITHCCYLYFDMCPNVIQAPVYKYYYFFISEFYNFLLLFLYFRVL